MDTNKGQAAPGLYLAWGALTILALVILWGMGGMISDWIEPAPDAPVLSAPTQ